MKEEVVHSVNQHSMSADSVGIKYGPVVNCLDGC